jgi:hypothetical protein
LQLKILLVAYCDLYKEKPLGIPYWLAFAAYVLPTFPLGYFWHLKTFAGKYHELGLYRAEVIIPMGLASMIIQGLFFAWMYPRLFNTAEDQWLSGAFQFGLIFGVLSWSFQVLPVAAKYNMTSVPLFIALETAFTAIQFATAGFLIALAYRGTILS